MKSQESMYINAPSWSRAIFAVCGLPLKYHSYVLICHVCVPLPPHREVCIYTQLCTDLPKNVLEWFENMVWNVWSFWIAYLHVEKDCFNPLAIIIVVQTVWILFRSVCSAFTMAINVIAPNYMDTSVCLVVVCNKNCTDCFNHLIDYILYLFCYMHCAVCPCAMNVW